MKKCFLIALLMLQFTFISKVFSQSVSINTTGNVSDTSAMLDITSLSKGLLIPRMSQAQKLAIYSPADGLLIYQTDGAKGFYFYNLSTPAWVLLAQGSGGITSLNGLSAASQIFATPGTLGTAPAWSSAGSAHTLNIPLASASGVTAGLLSNADYTFFNNKQSQLNGTGFIKVSGTTITYDNSTYLTANQPITFTATGDVTGSATGNASITPALTIGANKVTLSQMAQVATGTFLGRASAGTGNVEALTTAQAKTLLGSGGTNTGDVTVAGQSYLTITGQAITANPVNLSGTHVTGTLAAARFPALTGDVTNTAGTVATTIAAGVVSNTKLANMATQTFKGRTSAGSGSPEDLSAAQATAMLNTFTPTAKGLVPNSGGGTTSFLRADGTFAVPSGTASGSVTSVSVTTANGVSGSVATATTTPAISLALGDITPSSIAAAGTITGSNLSGTNTGDETNATIKTKLGVATATTDGYLTMADWNTFNNKASTTNSWSTAGNSGTSPGTNYLGTSDAQDVVLKANSIERLRIVAGVSSSTGTTGDITVGDVNSGTLRSAKELVMREDGDVYGPSTLRLRNRGGENGAIFETMGAAANLVDFIFRTGAVATPISSNIRFETRSQSLKVTGNTTEWQFGQPDVLNGGPTFVIGAAGTTGGSNNSSFRLGNVGIGTSSPATKLHVVGTNPLTLEGVVTGTNTTADSLLTISNGLVQKLPVATFASAANAISSLNGLTATSQTFEIPGTAGTAPAWISAGSSHTLNIPLASATGVTAGLLSNADWTTFNNKASTTNSWSTTGNAGLSSGTNFLGTTDLTSLRFRTNNIQRFIIDSLGNTAVGLNPVFTPTPNIEKLLVDAGSTAANPSTSYNVISGKGYLDNYLQLNIQNYSPTAAASSDIVASNDAATEAVNFIDMGINSSGNTSTGVTGGPSTAYLYSTGNDFAIGNAAANKNLTFFTNTGTGSTEKMRVSAAGKVGIGNTVPSEALDVTGNLKISGSFKPGNNSGVAGNFLQSMGSTSPPVWIDPVNYLALYSWEQTGNSGTNYATSFLGTKDNNSLRIRTNNTQRMLVDSLGNVAIGTSPVFSGNIEKLLVDAGVTNSFNVISGKGSINNYLQLNIQNKSSGTAASSDVVATADNGDETNNYVDLGINSSGNTSNYFGNANDGYLYNTGQNFLIGTASANKSLVFLTGGGTQSTNERMRIDGTGNVGIGTTAPATALHVSASINPLTLNGVAVGTNTTADSLLTITNGLVRKLPLSTFASATNAISSLNGLTATAQTFATPGTAGTAPAWVSAGSTHTLNIPLASALSVTAGLLSNTDWNTFNNKAGSITLNTPGVIYGATNTFNIAPGGAATATLTLNTQGANTFFAGPSTGANAQPAFRTIVPTDLPVATATNTGAVSIGSGLAITAGGVLSATNTNAGTVTSASVVTANGLAGTVANSTTTPAITLSTTVTGMVKGNGTALSAATSGTDYAPGTAANATGIVKSTTGTGALTTATAADFPILNQNTTGNAGTVTTNANLTGPVTSAGNVTAITNNAVTYSKMQAVSATSKLLGSSSTATNIQELTIGSGLSLSGTTISAAGSGGTVTSVSVVPANGVSGTVATPTTTPAITLTLGAITPSSVAATGTVTGSNLSGTNTGDETQATIKTKLGAATTSTDGYLTLADWNTFNNKANTGNVISSLNGLTATAQTFAVPGTAGIAPAWVSAGSVHTLNIPLASATGVTAGLLSNADWTNFNNKASTTNSWSTTGNAGTNPSLNFLGTTDNTSLSIRTNNIQGILLDSVGNVSIGSGTFTGTPNQEKLLVDAGLNALSFNVISGKGTINNYLQLNIQNKSSGLAASSDVVATADNGDENKNFIDMGINSSGYSASGILGGVNNAYLYSMANDFIIGNNTLGKPLRFYTTNTAGSAERLRIDSSGNIGIGSLAPSQKLDITGNVRFSGALMPNNNPGTSGTVLTSLGANTAPVWSTFSASAPLSLAGGIFTITQASATSNGYLSSTDWNTFNSKASTANTISSLNGLTATSQTFATGTTGTDFNIASSGLVHTFNIPDASATARGLITTAAQTVAGSKTFSSAPTFSTFTAGSLPFIGTGGLLSQNNSKLFWDNTNNSLGIGAAPASSLNKLDISGTGGTVISRLASTAAGDRSMVQVVNTAGSGGDFTFRAYGSAYNENLMSNNMAGGALMLSNGPASAPLAIGSFNAANFIFGTANTERMRILGASGYVGIGTITPATTLHVSAAANPLTLTGVQSGASTDSLLTITSAGLVRRLNTSNFASAANAWSTTGNTATDTTNFLGTTDNNGLRFRTNNIQGMLLDTVGNVLIGSGTFSASPNQEKFLVDAGSNTQSYNVISGKGTINSYLQLNIQNRSSGAAASSDVVATSDNGNESTNYVDMGINSSGYTGNYFGNANDGYLYSAGQNLMIGTGTTGKDVAFLTGGGTQSSGITTNNERMRISGTTGYVGIGINAPEDQLHVAATTATSNATPTDAATIETIGIPTTATARPPQLNLVRQFPTSIFTATNSNIGPVINFGFKSSGTTGARGDLAQIITTTLGANSRIGFSTRTGMTNGNPVTGTLAEAMSLVGSNVGVGTFTGTAVPVSTLEVNGSVGTAINILSAATTLTAANYTVIATGSSAYTVTLPSAASSPRRVYVIVNQTIARTVSSYLDFSGSASTTLPLNNSITLQSNGTNWYRIQ